MLKLPQITLCIVDTANHRLAREAVRHSMSVCTFGKVVIFSDQNFGLEGTSFFKISPLSSLLEYSRFMLKSLFWFIETEFVMVVQWDGFISDAAAWTEKFRGFDYIGAPWPQFMQHSVGNGGFSMRSKKLLEALQDDRFVIGELPEDIAIGRKWRSSLETQYGIRYPDRELARQFSYESEFKDPHFGFHGIYRLYHHYRGENLRILLENVAPRVIQSTRFMHLAAEYARNGFLDEARQICLAIIDAGAKSNLEKWTESSPIGAHLQKFLRSADH